MSVLIRLESFSDELIQKYNGKHVKIFNSCDIFCSAHKVVLTLRSSAISAADMLKFKKFLTKAGVKKIKHLNMGDLIVSMNLFDVTVENSILKNSFFHLFNFLGGSNFVIELDSLTHFFYFESKILYKLLKKYRCELVLFKMNNQYLLVASDEFKNIRGQLDVVKNNNSLRLFVFFYFQVLVVKNFLFFFLYYKFQIDFFNSFKSN